MGVRRVLSPSFPRTGVWKSPQPGGRAPLPGGKLERGFGKHRDLASAWSWHQDDLKLARRKRCRVGAGTLDIADPRMTCRGDSGKIWSDRSITTARCGSSADCPRCGCRRQRRERTPRPCARRGERREDKRHWSGLCTHHMVTLIYSPDDN